MLRIIWINFITCMMYNIVKACENTLSDIDLAISDTIDSNFLFDAQLCICNSVKVIMQWYTILTSFAEHYELEHGCRVPDSWKKKWGSKFEKGSVVNYITVSAL